MANIKSAKKRILVNETKAARNKSIKSRVKTAMKKVEAAVAANDKALATETLNAAIAAISKVSNDALMSSIEAAGFHIYDKNLYDAIAKNYPDYLSE